MIKLNSKDDRIYDAFKQVDLMCHEGKFSELDELLLNLDINNLGHEISVAWLMACYPAHKHLPSRSIVVEKFHKHLLSVMSESEVESIIKILRVKND